MESRHSGATLDYITRTFVTEPEWLASVRAEGERRRPGMQVSPYEGYVLHWLVRISGAKRILEIGTFMGYSTLWMAQALGEGGHITTLEFDAGHAAAAQAHIDASPHAAIIRLQPGNAHAWLAALPPEEKFDLVFIDAEKKGYADYLDAVLPHVGAGGFIIGDNTLLFGAMAGETEKWAEAKKAMTRFNATLADATQFDGIMLPTAEGLTVARKR